MAGNHTFPKVSKGQFIATRDGRLRYAVRRFLLPPGIYHNLRSAIVMEGIHTFRKVSKLSFLFLFC